MKMKHEAAMEIAQAMRNSLKIQNEIGFGDMNIKVPDIDFYSDEVLYFDSNRNEIHLGVYGIVDIFDVQDETDFVNATNYSRGHEEQHCRSTATTPYAWGIQRGMEVVLEYISSKEEKSKRRFRTSSDYMDFANRVLPGMGIYISSKLLMDIVGGISNAVEDGRIERLRSARFPGFEKLRVYYRGRFWNTQERQYKEWDDIKEDSAAKLEVIIDQILSLATCQLYSKGFIKTYAGTPMVDEVKALMPYIANGVMAGRTRTMATQVIEISKAIAPYIYDVCKLSAKDVEARKTLEKLLSDMLKSMVDSMPENSLSEQDEDMDEGGAASTFPHSDLVVTLDDDTYDKLIKKSKKQGDGSGGLMVQREHPKETEQESGDDKSDSGSQNGKSDNTKSNKPKGNFLSGDAEGKEETENNSASDSSEKSDDGQSESNSELSKGSDGAEKGEESGQSSADSKDNADSKKSTSNSSSKKENTSEEKKSGKIVGKNEDPNQAASELDMEGILSAMKEAAESVRESAKREIENINVHEAHERHVAGKIVADKGKPITAEDVKGICPNFTEMKRAYKLIEKLPPVLASRGRTLFRKNQRYFKSLSTPNVSFLDSGLVDPSRIYGLSFGDTQIFRKKGMDKKFDGCVYILIDNSGSMSGNKRIEACKAAAVIEESFRGLIPIKIVAFDYSGSVIHEVIKGWDEQQRLNCCWNFCLHGREGWGNADGYDIKIAAKELQARPEQKKLLIVLSDGMPAEASIGFTKGAIEETRKKGIQVTGIYFEEGSVIRGANDFRGMYAGDGRNEKDAICCNVKELDANLEAVMKRFSRS